MAAAGEDAEEHQNKRPLRESGKRGAGKKAKPLSASPSCLVSSVMLKEESEGEVAQAQGGRARGVVVAQANPPMELPRINVSLQPQLLHCAVTDCYSPLKPPVFKFNDYINTIFSLPPTVGLIVAVFLDNTLEMKDAGKDRGMPWWLWFRAFKGDSRNEEFYSLPFNLQPLLPSGLGQQRPR